MSSALTHQNYPLLRKDELGSTEVKGSSFKDIHDYLNQEVYYVINEEGNPVIGLSPESLSIAGYDDYTVYTDIRGNLP